MSEVLSGFEEMGNVVDNVGERHIACVLLVDTSGSMAGASINELNQGLLEFGNALDQDEQPGAWRTCASYPLIPMWRR